MKDKEKNTDLERNEIIKALSILKKPVSRGNLDSTELKLITSSIKQLESALRNLTY